ncbi:hypothetical protein [Acidovorax sp. Q11]
MARPSSSAASGRPRATQGPSPPAPGFCGCSAATVLSRPLAWLAMVVARSSITSATPTRGTPRARAAATALRVASCSSTGLTRVCRVSACSMAWASSRVRSWGSVTRMDAPDSIAISD